MDSGRAPNVLMIHPRFAAESFWNYTVVCDLVEAKYPAPPLGLITVAAMLPPDWNVRLVNRNTEELSDADLKWADMIMTGGMLFQQADTFELIKLGQTHGKPVVVGGPDVTSSPHVYEAADFRVLGEAESVIDQFIAAWNAGERKGVFEAPKFQADVTKTPIPRFDLLKFDQYLYIGVQFSRGCPFTCEFCDIIELYGRVPRTKTPEQMFAELDALKKLGYRGHVDFVDDNLIGNKKAVKAFLPKLAQWLVDNEHPFEFSTEASLNLSDDTELLQMMRNASFFGVFIGIESPDPETLVHTRKKQNTRRSIAESVHRIYAAGMYVLAGFIVGFDTEKPGMAEAMVDLIQDAAIPISAVTLLNALPNTQLTRRLAKEGRLHAGHEFHHAGQKDHLYHALNFEPVRPRQEVLRDYVYVLGQVYDPEFFGRRVERLASMLDSSGRAYKMQPGDVRQKLSGVGAVYEILNRAPAEHRDILWKAFKASVQKNPDAVRTIVTMFAWYLHLGPFSRQVISNLTPELDALETQTVGELRHTGAPSMASASV